VGRRLAATITAALCLAGAASAARVPPERREIRAADQAFARRANLGLGDLPAGLRVLAHLKNPFGPPLACRSFHPDLSDLTVTGEAASPVYGRPGLGIYSTVRLYRSIHDARADWSRTNTRAGLACGAKQMAAQNSSTVKVIVRRYAVRRAPRLGDRSLAVRYTCVLVTGGRRLKLLIDLANVARGRAEATLMYTSYAHAPSAVRERALLAKLARRLRGAK
jgi:hypothetical protein